MRNGMAWLVCVLVFAVGGLATWSLTRGQSPTDPPVSPARSLPAAAEARGGDGERGRGGERPSGSPSPLLPVSPSGSAVPGPRENPSAGDFGLRKQVEYSMGRGAEWLFRMNTVKGRFLPGFLPAVNAVMEGDSYLRQAAPPSPWPAAPAAPATRTPPTPTPPAPPRRCWPCSTTPIPRTTMASPCGALRRTGLVGNRPRRRRPAGAGHQRVARAAGRPARRSPKNCAPSSASSSGPTAA